MAWPQSGRHPFENIPSTSPLEKIAAAAGVREFSFSLSSLASPFFRQPSFVFCFGHARSQLSAPFSLSRRDRGRNDLVNVFYHTIMCLTNKENGKKHPTRLPTGTTQDCQLTRGRERFFCNHERLELWTQQPRARECWCATCI